MGERDGRLDDRRVAAVLGEMGDEAAVDLDLLYGKVTDVGQRAEPGAVVIHGQ